MRYRIIFSLFLDLGRNDDGSFVGLVVPLNRDGNGTRARPRAPKRRCIDLRPGDQVLCEGRWRTIESVEAYRDCWLSAEQLARWADEEGYLYRVA